jgi:hypothetical protein
MLYRVFCSNGLCISFQALKLKIFWLKSKLLVEKFYCLVWLVWRTSQPIALSDSKTGAFTELIYLK